MFVMFTNDHTKKRTLVNSDHVRSAHEVDGHKRVRLIMSGQGTSGHCEEVEGDLESVQVTLMGEQHSVLSEPSPPEKATPRETVSRFAEAVKK